MIRCRSPIGERLASSRPLLLGLIVVGCLLTLVSAVRFQAPELLGQRKVLTDFDAFYVAGLLGKEGRVFEAYHLTSLIAAQKEAYGTTSFMPWTYPPPFALAMQGLATLPLGAAFLLFSLASLGLYIRVLSRIAGPWLPGAVVAVMPAIILNLRTGQNGLLIAGLIGAFLLAFKDGRRVAGVPLGLLVIKPHLAIGAGLLVLLHRRWSVACIAAAIGLTLLAISTAAFGPAVWFHFRDAVTEAAGFLAAGYYPLFRMNSIYATAHSLGAGPAVAMALQICSAVTALGVLSLASFRGMAFNRLAALTCAASVCVSPYGYDYDLTLLGVAAAFIMPEVLERAKTRQFFWLAAMTWWVCGYGMAWTVASSWDTPATGVTLDGNNEGLALIAPVLLVLFWLTTRVLSQPRPMGDPAPV